MPLHWYICIIVCSYVINSAYNDTGSAVLVILNNLKMSIVLQMACIIGLGFFSIRRLPLELIDRNVYPSVVEIYT